MKAIRSRVDLAALVVLTVAIAGTLGVLPTLASDGLAWCYPYMGPDSWDWMLNGLAWSGVPVPSSHRPPGLPWVIALLHRWQASAWLPYLNFAMLGIAAALLHRLVRLRHSRLVAALAVLIFVSNGSLFGYVRFVMAEVWTLPLLLAATIEFVRSEKEPRRYLSCALLLALSFLFHYAGAIVGVAFAIVLLLHRRAALASRWPWLGLLVALPLPAGWLLLRALHNRSHRNIHVIERLVQPSFDNLAYYAVGATALFGLALLPLYLVGLSQLVLSRRNRRSAWAQAVLFPLLALALFFTLIYHWADKRFLYYLFAFAVAVATEALAKLLDFARRGRWQASGAFAVLALLLLWNRIPYPTGSHRLLALSPWVFVDGIAGWPGTRLPAAGGELLTSDGFFSYRRPASRCSAAAEQEATPALRAALATRLAVAEPVALLTGTADPGVYWSERNHFAVALERTVVSPDEARFAVRLAGLPGPAALATFGPFDLVELRPEAALRRNRRGRPGGAPAEREPRHRSRRSRAPR